jgi:hypothetical protein
LAWTRAIEVANVLGEHREQVALSEHDHVVEALASHATQKPAAHAAHPETEPEPRDAQGVAGVRAATASTPAPRAGAPRAVGAA